MSKNHLPAGAPNMGWETSILKVLILVGAPTAMSILKVLILVGGRLWHGTWT